MLMEKPDQKTPTIIPGEIRAATVSLSIKVSENKTPRIHMYGSQNISSRTAVVQKMGIVVIIAIQVTFNN